jgi:hypothetical protein
MASNLVQKDNKNRVQLGTEVKDSHFIREIDERGRIIFTPQVLVPKDEYQERLFVLDDAQRDMFVNLLLDRPSRNEAFRKAQTSFRKRYK